MLKNIIAIFMKKRLLLLFGLTLALAACDAFSAPTATPTPTATSTSTSTPPPSATPSPTITSTPSITPSPTVTATSTPEPTITPTPYATPEQTIGFTLDLWSQSELPFDVMQSMNGDILAFTNTNDQQTISNLSTAQPNTNIETLYYVSPSAGRLVPIMEFNASTVENIYISPNGNSIAYFQQDGIISGIYVVQMSTGFGARVLPLNSLVQRGFPVEPVWSPDGTQFAIMLATGYDTDIFVYNIANDSARNITNNGSYDLFPSWSPDGRYLAFVSDRETCPTWIQSEPGACVKGIDAEPIGGKLYIIDMVTGITRKLSDQLVTEAPVWINSGLLSHVVGDQSDILDPQRTIWTVNINSGIERQARLPDEIPGTLYLSESWSPDGNLVIFQKATDTETQTVLMNIDGRVIADETELNYPRFGLRAAWAQDGSLLAVGGIGGQCPYGIRVYQRDFSVTARGNPPPTMCNPQYSPGGGNLAFTGINPSVDGQLDVYLANVNGFGQRNLTSGLRGQNNLLGWITLP